jgi:hypothetical protein
MGDQVDATVGVVQESSWRDYAEDATGFGAAEWRTGRDLLIRPRAVLDAYLAGGPTGFGRYSRPFRYYLTLCGVLMFYLFLAGGNRKLYDGIPPALVDRFAALAGKNRVAFITDSADWLGIVAVPVLSAFYALAFVPFIRWWGSHRWRLATRATLAMMCAWTVPMLLFGPLPFLDRYRAISAIPVALLLVIAFLRMGRGLWWSTPLGSAGKSLVLLVAINIVGTIGMVVVIGLAALGVRLTS